jgi:iron complex transport system ATP-binding protein
MMDAPLLQVENLTLAVPGKILCRGLSFDIRPGECWAILGANGSGKTTLLHALSGLGEGESGRILWQGRPLAEYARRDLARGIGLLPQGEAPEYWGTVREYVRLGRFPHDGEDVTASRDALQRCGMQEFSGRRLGTLSGGERQRVRIAQLLAQAPRLYCLDEPLQHLDLRHQGSVMALLRGLAALQASAVAMVLHEPWWALRHCTHALLMPGEGHILCGTAESVLTRVNLEMLYGKLPFSFFRES